MLDPTQRAYRIEDGVTQSMLARFCDCRASCGMHLTGWRTDKPKRSLQFGSLMHAMLEGWYKAQTREDPIKVFGEVARAHERSAAKAGDDPKEVQSDLGQAKALFPAYVERWRKDDERREWVEVEQVFDVDFDGTRLRGKIDGVFRAPDKTLWILETKTASQISDETMSLALAFDFQSLFYCEAIERKLGERVSGVLYNVIRVPQIGKGEDRGSEAFCKRLREDIASRPDFYFARYELAYPKPTRLRFAAELRAKLDVFRRWIAGDEPTYQNEQACRKRWNCEYMEACACGGVGFAKGYKQTGKLFNELAE